MKSRFQWWKLEVAAVVLPGIMFGSITLLAAMSDAKALSEARKLFGPMGGIATSRGQLDTYWTKQVGVHSLNCKVPFTVLGSGLNLWEAAFFQVPANAVLGPISGQMMLRHQAWDNVGITEWQWYIDGTPLGPKIINNPATTYLEASLLWDTATGPPGKHVLCGAAWDAAGNIGRSRAIVVNIDASVPRVGGTIDFRSADGVPVVGQ